MPDDPGKSQLRPAATNPWYVLMTVAGEHAGTRIDTSLHARNRRYWNGWQAQALSDKKKAKLIQSGCATEAELAPFSDDEDEAIAEALRKRCPSATRPEPGHRLDLSGSTFEERLICGGFIFSEDVDFRSVTFSGDVFFNNAIFFGKALFESVTFSESAVFHSATFSGAASFHSATFSRYAGLTSAAFAGRADFESATFSGDAFFDGVTFSEDAAFSDATFRFPTCFGPRRNEHIPVCPVRFLQEPPAFFGTTLHEDTDFTDVAWPPVPDDADPARRRTGAIRHRRAYERLKLLMDSQKKVADELMFQRLELRCREVEATGDWRSREWWVARASRLFGALSDYGWDPVKPVLYLGGLILAGWALIFVAEWWDYNLGAWPDPDRPAEYLGLGRSFALSLSNVFGFLGLNRTFLADEVRTLTTASEIVSTVQTVAGLVLLFLLGLALRNRFRIK